MEFFIKKAGDTIIINLYGKLDIQHFIKIENDLNKLITSKSSSHFIINLENLEYISSTGQGLLLNTMGILKKAGRKLILCNMNYQVRRIFELVELNDVFVIVDSEADALDYLKKINNDA